MGELQMNSSFAGSVVYHILSAETFINLYGLQHSNYMLVVVNTEQI